MIRRFHAIVALVLLSSYSAFNSQSYSQIPTQSDLLGQQSTSLCQDGSAPVTTSDGSTECLPSGQQQLPGVAPQIDTRRNTVSGTAENGTITGQPQTRNLMQNQLLPPEPLTEFQKFVAATTGQLLPIYGAKLFRDVPSTFSPNDLAPVTSDYVIGPDDELRVRIWGQVNYSGNLRVDRSGDIYLPEAGAVHVAGIQFSALDQHLRAALARVYRNFDLSVDIGRIRSMQIYVTGQARRAGVYTVSSLSTLVDALFVSGGPSAQGSLRHIEVRRDGKTIADFDLYALLIHGDKSKDVRLLPEDVLYIPAVGPQVAITGSVHDPGIYEIRENETIGELIDAAGKTTSLASSTRISLERSAEHQTRQAMQFTFDTTGLSAHLAGGDILRVYSIVPAYQKTVTLRGNVANPGRFAWHSGMKLSDLIPDKDSLLSRDYWWKRSRLGLPAPDFEPFLTNFEVNKGRPLTGTSTPPTNNPCGNIRNLIQPNLPNSNSTQPNNNFDPTSPAAQCAFTEDIQQVQQVGKPNYNAEAPESTGAVSPADANQLGTIASQFSQITTQDTSLEQKQKTDVRSYAPEIDWSYAVIERQDTETLKTSLISFDLGKLVLNHDASQDLALQPGDTVTIFSQADIRVPLDEQTKYINLEGEFVHSGVYSVKPGETLREVVLRAGGLTSKAYLYGSEFDRESTRRLQQQRIDEYVRKADLDASRGTLALVASATTSNGGLANAPAANSAEQTLLTRLKQLRATGRIVLNFPTADANIDQVPDIQLENGDRFLVPPAPATVNVVGAVYDQNSFLYHSHESIGQYLQVAGGPDRYADSKNTFLIRADGSVVARNSVKGLWGNGFNDMKLNPGDTIVVPDKTLHPTVVRSLLDWSQIFSQLALGAAAIGVLR